MFRWSVRPVPAFFPVGESGPLLRADESSRVGISTIVFLTPRNVRAAATGCTRKPEWSEPGCGMQPSRIEKVADRHQANSSRRTAQECWPPGRTSIGHIEPIRRPATGINEANVSDEIRLQRTDGRPAIQIGVVWPRTEGSLTPEPSGAVSIKGSESFHLDSSRRSSRPRSGFRASD